MLLMLSIVFCFCSKCQVLLLSDVAYCCLHQFTYQLSIICNHYFLFVCSSFSILYCFVYFCLICLILSAIAYHCLLSVSIICIHYLFNTRSTLPYPIRSTLLTYSRSSLANTLASQYKISGSIQQQANTAQQSTILLHHGSHNPPLSNQ